MPARFHVLMQNAADLDQARLRRTIEDHVHRVGHGGFAALVAAMANGNAVTRTFVQCISFPRNSGGAGGHMFFSLLGGLPARALQPAVETGLPTAAGVIYWERMIL